jgi:FkbM family methyltransferase
MQFIEPNPTVVKCLRRTLAGLEDWPICSVHEVAASDRNGTADLHLAGASGMASLVPRRGARVVSVPTIRLSDLLDLRPDDRVAFKIDVEGHELPALTGLLPALVKRQFVGVCEVEHADDQTLDFLYRRFMVSVLTPTGEQPVEPGRSLGIRNVILRPNH